MARSILAVGGGFLAMLTVVLVGTAAATAALMPGGLAGAMAPPGPNAPPLPGSYLVANLLVSLAGAAIGGWIVGRFAPHSPGTHVVVLTLIVFALGAASAVVGSAPGQPVWYPWTVTVIGVVAVTLGGMLRPRRP
jgi:hypothetical protein